jgi:L-lactate dehydrogenase complex protein LldF
MSATPSTTRTRRPLPTFQASAKRELANTQLRRNLHKATHATRAKSAEVVSEMPDWQELREAGRALKERALRHLDIYLLELEAAVQRAGGHVHWARDAQEANAIVTQLVAEHGAREAIKVKSLTTDEIKLNRAREASGIAAIETDLAELIIQLAGESSSHILVPAIHKNRAEIRELFMRTLDVDELTDDPHDLANVARTHPRRKFLSASVAISGVNFAVAETGTVCVVESEGDGPQEFHLVPLDNGRTQVFADTFSRQTLNCIRCSACLNICPIYERVGGYAYSSVYPGPIGSILTPQLIGIELASSLPYASSLCGVCYDVCPVKMNIPEVLIYLRGRVVLQKQVRQRLRASMNPENVAMKLMARTFASRKRYEQAQRLAQLGQLPFVHGGVINALPVRWRAGRHCATCSRCLGRAFASDGTPAKPHKRQARRRH